MRENLITLRLRNARLERELASRQARRTIRRIRTELARRGLTFGQRESVLHDSLLMLAESEAAGADPIEVLLGTNDVSVYDAAVQALCDGVAEECPRLPVALVVIRFFALMLVSLAVVFAGHLAFRLASAPPGGWLSFYMVNLRTTDMSMLKFECTLVPVLFLILQIISSLMPRNPWPHALPAVATPVVFGVMLFICDTVGPFVLPGEGALYNPLHPEALKSLESTWSLSPAFGAPVDVLFIGDDPWMNVNYFLVFAGIIALALIGLGITYLIERRGLKA